MKLKKLLLPIASVASVAAIVTPILTSCGKKGGYTLNGNEFYIPESAQAEWDYEKHPQEYTIPEATKLYFDDLANNPKIFEEDIITNLALELYVAKMELESEFFGSLGGEGEIKVQYSDVTVNTEAGNTYSLSFKVTGSVNVSLYTKASKAINGGNANQIENLKSFSMEVSHIPYTLYSEADYEWDIVVGDISVLPDTASVKARADGYFIGDYGLVVCDNKEFVVDKDHSYENLTGSQRKFLEACYAVFCSTNSSYHMANIPYLPL